MKRHLWVLVLVLGTTPVFGQSQGQGQDLDELRELGMGATFGLGNLALRDAQRGDDPVQQLKRFFAQAKLPITSPQERKLEAVVEGQVAALQAAQNDDAVRHVNLEYTRKLNEILTPDQQAEWRRYRTEQIMLRGGFPALRLILENAQAPFTSEQETQVLALYNEFNQQVLKLPRDAKGRPDRTELDKLENQALGKVIRLLNPPQRRALAASRQGTLTSKVRP